MLSFLLLAVFLNYTVTVWKTETVLFLLLHFSFLYCSGVCDVFIFSKVTPLNFFIFHFISFVLDQFQLVWRSQWSLAFEICWLDTVKWLVWIMIIEISNWHFTDFSSSIYTQITPFEWWVLCSIDLVHVSMALLDACEFFFGFDFFQLTWWKFLHGWYNMLFHLMMPSQNDSLCYFSEISWWFNLNKWFCWSKFAHEV